MPISNLQPAAPSGVFPNTTYTIFEPSMIFPMLAANYNDGTTERALIVDGVNLPQPLLSWKLAVRKTHLDLQNIKSFFEGQQGGLIPFYWYDPFDTDGGAIGSNYDESGTNQVGRHTVRFNTPVWNQTVNILRTTFEFQLVEVA